MNSLQHGGFFLEASGKQSIPPDILLNNRFPLCFLLKLLALLGLFRFRLEIVT